MSDDEYDVHTPTQSELATFQVMANLDFVNLQRLPDAVIVEEEEHEEANVEVVEDEEEVPPVEEEEEEIPVTPLPRLSPLPSPKSEKHFTPLAAASPLSSFQPVEPPPLPRTRKPKDATRAEIDAEKEGLLNELHQMERNGSAKLVRPLTMNDTLEEIQFQYDRIQAELNATQMVDFAKSAIKMGSGMVEMLLKKAGIQVVDGYHTNLCKDMNKFNRPLNRLYKKYWRRGGMSPEAELGMLVLGSLAWTVVQNKMGSATAAFGGDVPAPATVKESTAPANTAARPMRPPQMSSLNVPSAWTAPPPPKEEDPLVKELQQKVEALEKARLEIMQKDEEMRKFNKMLDEKSRLLDAKLQALQEEEEEEEEQVPETKKVSIQDTVTPRKSSRKKTEVLQL